MSSVAFFPCFRLTWGKMFWANRHLFLVHIWPAASSSCQLAPHEPNYTRLQFIGIICSLTRSLLTFKAPLLSVLSSLLDSSILVSLDDMSSLCSDGAGERWIARMKCSIYRTLVKFGVAHPNPQSSHETTILILHNLSGRFRRPMLQSITFPDAVVSIPSLWGFDRRFQRCITWRLWKPSSGEACASRHKEPQ